MTGGGESEGTRSVLYCVVPRDLATKLHDTLREHFRDRADVQVVVERRSGDRRASSLRRTDRSQPDAAADERRLIHSAAGRRVAERRAITVPAAPVPELPRKARRSAAQLVFLERLEPAAQNLQDADSKRLVIRYQAGEDEVFGELYLRYFDPVYSYARVALGEHHDAEDLTQQVFAQALAGLKRYRLQPSVPFRGWLFAIARNAMVDALRARGRVRVESPEQLSALRECGSTGRAAQTLDWLTDREIAMFVDRLPLPQRQVLLLRFMLDLSGEETARILGRSHASVRQLQARALASLEQRLVAVGRTSTRRGRVPMRLRMKPLPVVVGRRFALNGRHGAVPGAR